MSSIGINIAFSDPKDNPRCPHGPTLLFKRGKVNFYACSASRDRKNCSFYVLESDLKKYKAEIWKEKEKHFLKGINHRKKFVILNNVMQKSINERTYCLNCSQFIYDENSHSGHKLLKNLTDFQLKVPSEILPPLDNSKVEAQYLFSKNSTKEIVNILKSLNYKNVICLGAPRIYEYINNFHSNISTLLLDIDKRFHDFFGPLEFCWYNLFNNHFFFDEAKQVFEDFLTSNNGADMVLITDPPFGGRTEPIIVTLGLINDLYRKVNNTKDELPIFWIFPYFMEPHILNGLPNFKMLDYRVEYDNHPLFHDGLKGRKQGSPVRIFTNVDCSLIKLPEDRYKYCKKCKLWTSLENKHCNICSSCTSKDGRTYVHCNICNKCVKPTWVHCNKCNKCTLQKHKCEKIPFTKECFLCNKSGHKKDDCPNLNTKGLKRCKVEKSTNAKKLRR